MTNNANRRVLVVDDNRSIHEDFRAILSARDAAAEEFLTAEHRLFGTSSARPKSYSDFTVDSAYQGQEAVLKAMESGKDGMPYAVAFVDMRMPPGWDGIETVQHLWEVDDRIEVVLCTAYADRSIDELLKHCGETDRLLIIKKPFDPDEVRLASIALCKKWQLARQAELRQCELENLVDRRTAAISLARDATVYALAKLAESRDPETGDHLARMREFSQIIAEELSEDSSYTTAVTPAFLRDFYRATPLHDIGKVGIPDVILLKPGKLTAEEFEIMKSHTAIGAETLEETAFLDGEASFLKMAAAIARSHHERYDGSGYPDGLRQSDIPLAARIVSVADVFDALTSRRVYKEAMPLDEATQYILSGAGNQFDPEVVAAFDRCYDRLIQSVSQPNPFPVTCQAAGGLLDRYRDPYPQEMHMPARV